MSLVCKICCQITEVPQPIDENTKNKLALCLPEVKPLHRAIICINCLTMLNISDVFASMCLNDNHKFISETFYKPMCALCGNGITDIFMLDEEVKLKLYICLPNLKVPVRNNLTICGGCLYMINIMQNLKKIVQNSRGNYVTTIKGNKYIHNTTFKTNLKSNQSTTTNNLPINIGTNLIEIIDNKLKSGSVLQTQSSEDMFTCEKCGTCFTNLNDLTEHKKKHIEYNPYYCAICNKSFECVSNLRKHVSIHLRQGNYYRIESLKCARCKAPFPTLRDLAHHYCNFKQEVDADGKM